MKNLQRAISIAFIVLISLSPSLATDLFPTEARRQGFLQALAEQGRNYDPDEQMLRSRFSSPGYHTTLRTGEVHRTRESLGYAVALLDTGDAPLRPTWTDEFVLPGVPVR